MERLYTTDLMINGRKATYEVVFENDAYVFHPQGGGELQPFAVKREEDEWHPQGPLDNSLKEEAIASLENYLLSQH
jgi:hypothetical protein